MADEGETIIMVNNFQDFQVSQTQYVTLQLEDGTEALGEIISVSDDGQATVKFVQEVDHHNTEAVETNILEPLLCPVASTPCVETVEIKSQNSHNEPNISPVKEQSGAIDTTSKKISLLCKDDGYLTPNPLVNVPEIRTPGGALIIRADDLEPKAKYVAKMDSKKVSQSNQSSKSPSMDTFYSSLQALTDLVVKCTDIKQYHCPMCDRFKPTDHNMVIQHLIRHWDNRIPYKDGYLLKCCRPCFGDLKGLTHYHCPECTRLFQKRKNITIHLVRVHDAPPALLIQKAEPCQPPQMDGHDNMAEVGRKASENLTSRSSDLIPVQLKDGKSGFIRVVPSVQRKLNTKEIYGHNKPANSPQSKCLRPPEKASKLMAKVVANPKIVIGNDGMARIISHGLKETNVDGDIHKENVVQKTGNFLLLPVPKGGKDRNASREISVPLHGKFSLEDAGITLQEPNDINDPGITSNKALKRAVEHDISEMKRQCQERPQLDNDTDITSIEADIAIINEHQIEAEICKILASKVDSDTINDLIDVVRKPIKILNEQVRLLKSKLDLHNDKQPS